MRKSDTTLIDPADVVAALGLLSRLPLRVDMEKAQARGARAAWAYPVAGACLGALTALIISIALWIGISPVVAAGLALITITMMTGAMHEDGLADSFDGLWGGWDREKRLAIMKDSQIGTYGVLALVLSIGLRWMALATIVAAEFHWPALIAIGAVSRAAMVPVMAALPHARPDGLSRHVGRPPAQVAWIALSLAFMICLLALGVITIWIVLVGFVVTSIWAATARQKIGGQTGDILGATQQMNELALLILMTSL
ncbi:adenosylcobinamide-GDP ribazoletransferase [Yoonia sp. 208BN28-4]|uniref:adenosylcobinamide-GDP ribazoletransferase n=1 Tax=Yoonia sp. 208BN28-4 TaxID=3126505 RepID=UPI0030B5A7C3